MAELSQTEDAAALPDTGFIRIGKVLQLIPVSRTTWWKGIKDGRYPESVKLGCRTVAWRVEDIRSLIEELGQKRG